MELDSDSIRLGDSYSDSLGFDNSDSDTDADVTLKESPRSKLSNDTLVTYL